jgi:hypothetical protein
MTDLLRAARDKIHGRILFGLILCVAVADLILDRPSD